MRYFAKGIGRSGDGLHLGVGGHVAERLREVVGTGEYAVLAHDDGSDGNLACIIGCLRLVEGTLHVEFIFLLLIFHAAKVVLFLGKRTNKRHINIRTNEIKVLNSKICLKIIVSLRADYGI